MFPDIFPGFKTITAAALALFVAVNHATHWVPDRYEQSILALATALGLYGLKCAIERARYGLR